MNKQEIISKLVLEARFQRKFAREYRQKIRQMISSTSSLKEWNKIARALCEGRAQGFMKSARLIKEQF